ncbi:MFS transporter [Niveibacterium terrae]|uniref:MFS transporter n=1 Tax=Niveibacterium terrae TaxID=3373598 RepID=UPI003A93B305
MSSSAPHRPAAVGFILITVFLDVLGIGLVVPVLPQLIGHFTSSFQSQSLWFGLLSAIYGTMQFFFAPLLGALSDRFGRRPVLLLSVFGLAVNFLIMATAQSLGLLLAGRVLGGMTASSFSVAGAYIADVTAPEDRSRKMGLIGAMFGLGFIVGPMLGGLLGGIDLRLPFFVAAALALINGLYGLFILPESLPRERRTRVPLHKANPFSALLALGRLKGIGLLVWVYALMALAQFMNQTTWVLFTNLRFGWGPQQSGASLAVVGLVAVVVQGGLLGRLLKRYGEGRLVTMGLASTVVVTTAFGLVTRGSLMYVLIAANFLAYAIGPSIQGLVSKASDPSAQGQAMGSLNAINSVMIVIGPLIGAPLLAMVSHLPRQHWAVGTPMFAMAGIEALALLLAWMHLRRRPLA